MKTIYVKITDKYIYTYHKMVKTYEARYISNGKVNNVPKLSLYLKKILKEGMLKKKYIFILDPLLCYSDLFVYRYVFENMGLISYQIISDLDIIKKHLNNENIIIMNWTSSISYAYLNNNDIVCCPLNINIINRLDKQYIMLVGDTKISEKIKIPIYQFEYGENVIFNYL